MMMFKEKYSHLFSLTHTQIKAEQTNMNIEMLIRDYNHNNM